MYVTDHNFTIDSLCASGMCVTYDWLHYAWRLHRFALVFCLVQDGITEAVTKCLTTNHAAHDDGKPPLVYLTGHFVVVIAG